MTNFQTTNFQMTSSENSPEGVHHTHLLTDVNALSLQKTQKKSSDEILSVMVITKQQQSSAEEAELSDEAI